MKRNNLIAIAGGIASGKSVVLDTLRELGANVLSCDIINRELLNSSEYITKIGAIFPNVVENGAIDKLKLRELIVNDASAKATLESLAHPLIKAEILRRAEEFDGNVFVEVPLLKNAGMDKFFDRIWFVRTPFDKRVNYLMSRDNLSQESAIRFIKLQKDEELVEYMADCIIFNDSTYNQLCDKVKRLYQVELQHFSPLR